MTLSIVTTLYKSSPFLDRFIIEISEATEKLNILNYELIFVNDGSPDDSLRKLLEVKQNNNRIKIIDLSRNFGHHYALLAGIEYAHGDYVYIVDNDLETPTSFFEECYRLIQEDTALDMVYGVQEKRKGKFVENIGGAIFWKIFNYLSDTKVPPNIVTECLMTRKFVDELKRLNDVNLFFGGMVHWVGLNKKNLYVKKGLREGKNTYSFTKRVNLMIQAITSFTGKPLEILFKVGVLITILSILGILWLLIQKSIFGSAIEIGWTSLIAINFLVLGIISMFLGIIGIYLFKIFRQVQNRPNIIINKIYE